MNTEQLSQFNRDGFLIIENYLTPSQIDACRACAEELLESADTSTISAFETGDKQISDTYFLTSGSEIRPFFEPGAIEDGHLIIPKSKAINKIGHNIHSIPPFNAITHSASTIASQLGIQDARVLQSMIIFKQPSIGAEVPLHQDSTFLYTDPPSAIGFWIALEDCTSTNGTLSFAPGSHVHPITRRFIRKDGGTGFIEMSRAREYEMVEVEIKKGSLVLIHGSLTHSSSRNLSEKSRWIYTFHVIDGRYEYDEKNWLQPTQGGFTKL